ncbi:MAG TPA: hypothetical protein VIR63_01110 [Pontiella sp.]
MTKNKNKNPSDKRVAIISLLLCMVVFIIDSLLPLGVAGGVPYIAVILVSLWTKNQKLPLYMAVICSSLTLLGLAISPPGGEFWKVITNRMLALFAIWVVTILSIQRKRLYLDKANALEEIKILKGFLPTCASCRKIRDEQGDWKDIESYISQHSEAQFSHGICPECAKKIYPGIDVYPDKKPAQ